MRFGTLLLWQPYDGPISSCDNSSLISPLSWVPGTRSRRRGYFDEIVLGIVMHFLFYIALVLLANPESYRSTGRHQEIGDCNHVTYLNTIMGQVSLIPRHSTVRCPPTPLTFPTRTPHFPSPSLTLPHPLVFPTILPPLLHP